MFPRLRRWIITTILAISFLLIAFHALYELLDGHPHNPHNRPPGPLERILYPGFFHPRFRWRNVKLLHPPSHLTALPTGGKISIPQVQHDFQQETSGHAAERKRRLRAVEESFKHSWEGYKKNAWLQDEVSPLSAMPRNPFGGWGATLIDTLDLLWIMGLKSEFKTALRGLEKIDFTTSSEIHLNVFETTIRYLGGLLSAYDVSGHKYSILLRKATELGDMLYFAFDTPNRLPITRWDWQQAVLGKQQSQSRSALLAEVGSLSLEFTRLSQLTGNPKWYDAVARVTDAFEEQQNQTKIPGLWPVRIDTQNEVFTKDSTFTLGGMADSLYEYLPKQHILLGGHSDQYRNMYFTALPAAKEHIFFRPLNPQNLSMLLPGSAKKYSANVRLMPEGEHLACFAGGMVALGAKIFRQEHDLETARELVDGCYWAYTSMPSGIMPEIFTALPCQSRDLEECGWDDTTEALWRKTVVQKANKGNLPEPWESQAVNLIQERKLAPGFTEIRDPRYILRPEAIESVFVLYRITGDKKLQDMAWEMFQAIEKAARTDIAYAALADVRQSGAETVQLDNMESFWTAETLKYFYLIFCEPDVISLDDYVLNTEAHPLLRPK